MVQQSALVFQDSVECVGYQALHRVNDKVYDKVMW